MDHRNPLLTREAFQDLLDGYVALLAQETGLAVAARVAVFEPMAHAKRADALVDIRIEGERQRYVVEYKNKVDRYVLLGQLKTLVQEFEYPGLLLTPYVTPAIAKRCRELEIAFLDGVGNAYLKTGKRYVLVTGNRPEVHRTVAGPPFADAGPVQVRKQTGAATPTALRVMFALLCKPQLINAPYREIREAAGVALGAIGWVLFNLNERGLVVGKQGMRRLVDKTRLFEEWVVNYPLRLRPKLNAARFRAPAPDWWRHTKLGGEQGAYWGGEAGADRLTGYLTPATQTIYVRPDRRREMIGRLVAKHRLHPDDRGNIEFVDAFWHFDVDQPHDDVAPPVLIYADLVATADPRNVEAAKLIRERYIDDALHRP
jgi:hypothetical protein